MRVNCYNASEAELASVTVGDTFYFDGELCIKVDVNNVDVIPPAGDRCYVVELGRGYLKSVRSDARVIMAETTAVATIELKNE